MTQIIGTNKQSKCMYCGAESYGIGCPYSPHHKHVHVDDPKRCIYCGSTSYGIGCPYNPFGKIHIHGIEFNQMMRESVFTSFVAGLLISRLTQPINETEAYKKGLVNEQGMKLKIPTEEEKNLLTPIDYYIFKLKRILGEEKVQLLNSSTIIEILSENKEQPFNHENYEKEIKIKSRIENLVEEAKNIISAGCQEGISRTNIENMFIEQFLKSGKND